MQGYIGSYVMVDLSSPQIYLKECEENTQKIEETKSLRGVYCIQIYDDFF